MNKLEKNGYVIVKNIYSKNSELLKFVNKTSDESNTTNGFFDLYHDDLLAQIRQDNSIYETFVQILNEPNLWVMFDRIIHVTKPEQELPLHVDQNPHTHPHFHGVQGLLALTDNNDETGTLTLIPGSHKWFYKYKEWSNETQGWVPYLGSDKDEMRKNEVRIYLKKGDLVIWDSRVTHSRYSPKIYTTPRTLVMISYIKAPQNEELRRERIKAFNSGIGVYNHDAGLRKTGGTKTPSLRVNPENLSPLGRKLYGLDSWNEKIKVCLLVICEEYGFGPVSTAQKISKLLFPRVKSIDFVGTDYTCSLQEKENYTNIYKVDSVANWLSSNIGMYDCLINVMDFSIRNVGIPTVIIDQLGWYWDEKKESSDLYLSQRWLKSQDDSKYVDRLPINPVQKTEKQYKVLVNFGGLINPFLTDFDIKNYVNLVGRSVNKIYDSVKMIGNDKLREMTGLDIHCVSIETSLTLLQNCDLFIGTSGIGNICEVADLKKPHIWLPPTNPSQAKQLELINTSNSIDWHDLYEDEKLPYFSCSNLDLENSLKNQIKRIASEKKIEEKFQSLLLNKRKEYTDIPVSSSSYELINRIMAYLHRFNVISVEYVKIDTLVPVSELFLRAHLPILYTNHDTIRIKGSCKENDLPHYAYHILRSIYIQKGYFVVHAACVLINGKTILLVGKSGTGKTTLLLKYTKKGGKVISTDKTILDENFNIMGGTSVISVRKPNENGRREYISVDVERKMYGAKIDVVKLLTNDGECEESIFSLFCDMERSSLTYFDFNENHVFLSDKCCYEKQKIAFFEKFRNQHVVRKNVLYGICGIGAGHKYRSIPIINGLLKEKNSVTIVTYGSGVPFFESLYKNNRYVKVIQTSETYYIGNEFGLSFLESYKHSLTMKKQNFECDILETLKNIDENGPYDLCLSDYEEMVAKYSYGKNIPLITIDQQSKYLCGDFTELKVKEKTLSHLDEVERLSMFFPKAYKRFAFSFFKVDTKDSNVTILSPLIRGVEMVQPNNSTILVYISDQNSSNLLLEIINVCKDMNKYQFHIFTNTDYSIENSNIKIYKHGDSSFESIFAICGGVVSTAGHMLLSECMYYNKPVYCIPLPLYEQAMNAKVINDNSFGISRDSFTEDNLTYFLSNLDVFRERIAKDVNVLNKRTDFNLVNYLCNLEKYN